MTTQKQSVPANEDEISLYTYTGEALWKIQAVEQALSFWITLKLNPKAGIAQAGVFLKNLQSYTLGRAIRKANENRLFSKSFQKIIDPFLDERNWLINKSISEIQHEFDRYDKRKEIINNLCKRIKAISDTAQIIQHEIEYDMIHFCESQNRDISKIREILKLQESGKRIYKY
jgi:hypothetical protein